MGFGNINNSVMDKKIKDAQEALRGGRHLLVPKGDETKEKRSSSAMTNHKLYPSKVFTRQGVSYLHGNARFLQSAKILTPDGQSNFKAKKALI